MDFSKQCKRFLNYRVINHDTLKKRFSNISALALLKNTQKLTKDTFVVTNKFVFHDNEEKCSYLVNETDGRIEEHTNKNLSLVSYGICCTSHLTSNIVYITDYNRNMVRKFDENLKELGQLKLENDSLNGPCQITINESLEQIYVIDQNNCRIVVFDLKTEEFLSAISLFEEELSSATKSSKRFRMDLTVRSNSSEYVKQLTERTKLEFKPFAICTKNERIYITDWNRGLLYIYKNNKENVFKLERRFGESAGFTRPRDILLDSLDSILVADLDKDTFYVLDNKGVYLFETKVPKSSKPGSYFEEKGVYGLLKAENKIIFASNSSIYICNLNAISEY